jgi:hypothetical protein
VAPKHWPGTSRRAARLLALAIALLARLGHHLLPLANSGPLVPFVVPPFTRVSNLLPLCLPGLPGDWTPQTGGEP